MFINSVKTAVSIIIAFFITVGTPANLRGYAEIKNRELYYADSDGVPYIAFRESDDDSSCGTWWWDINAAKDTSKRDSVLSFLQKNGVNEIYYYGMYQLMWGQDKDVHSFVEAANDCGMSVALLYDDPNLAETENSDLEKICGYYLNYIAEYPDDNVKGIHLDVEGAATEQFVSNLISQFNSVREKGIYLAVDVAPRLETETQFEMDGVKGNIYDMYASHVDCINVMSYRDTSEAIWRYGKEAYQAAMRQNCRIILAAETGLYDCNDDCVSFYEEDMTIMYLKMSHIYQKLALVHPEKGYGIAFHCSDTWQLMETGV